MTSGDSQDAALSEGGVGTERLAPPRLAAACGGGKDSRAGQHRKNDHDRRPQGLRGGCRSVDPTQKI